MGGRKFRLTDDLNRVFPKRKQCLIEPFVGAGAVFLILILSVIFWQILILDLINLFNIVKENVDAYIEACKPIFFAENANTADYYYAQRDAFNQSSDPF